MNEDKRLLRDALDEIDNHADPSNLTTKDVEFIKAAYRIVKSDEDVDVEPLLVEAANVLRMMFTRIGGLWADVMMDPTTAHLRPKLRKPALFIVHAKVPIDFAPSVKHGVDMMDLLLARLGPRAPYYLDPALAVHSTPMVKPHTTRKSRHTEPPAPDVVPAPVSREARPILTTLDALEVLADATATEAEIAAALALLR